jgi:hypothetical protein
MDQDPIVALLTEIRDCQREHLAEYRRHVSLAQDTHRQHAAAVRLWRRVILFGSIAIAACVAVLVYLFTKL